MKTIVGAAVVASVPILLFFGGMALVVWWLTEQFGPIAAVVTVGALVGIAIFWAGGEHTRRTTRHALEIAAELTASNTSAHNSTMVAIREQARLERTQFGAEARAALEDTKRVERLGRQYAGILMDAQQQSATRQPAAAWAMDDDDASEGVRYYE
jgi:hypothetical protein